jgi:hypothetical protein
VNVDEGMYRVSYHWNVDGSDVYEDTVTQEELESLREEQGFIEINCERVLNDI